MNHYDSIREQLSAYLDGELTPSQTLEVEQALAAEPALQRELEQLRALRKRLRQLPVAQTSDDFISRVLHQAERRRLKGSSHSPSRRESHWLRRTAVAACIALALGAGGAYWFFLQPSPTDTDQNSERVAVAPQVVSTPIDRPAAASPAAVEPPQVAMRLNKSLEKGGKFESYDRDLDELNGAVSSLPDESKPSETNKPTTALAMVGAERTGGDAKRDLIAAPSPARQLSTRAAAPAPVAAPAEAEETSEVTILADNLPKAQKDVELALASCNVQPLMLAEAKQVSEKQIASNVMMSYAYQTYQDRKSVV